MQLAGASFDPTIWWLAALLDGIVLALALWRAPWRGLARSGLFNVYAGACVVAWLTWSLTTPADAGFAWHLSGMVSLTLIFGWSLAVVAGAVAQLALHGAGLGDLSGLAPTLLAAVLVPALLAQGLLLLARRWLPRHYVVYVFFNAFLAGGLAALFVALASVVLLGLGTPVSWEHLDNTYLRYIPLMFFPEAMFNGMVMVVLVGYKPHWVRSFSDSDYLDGK
jgi:uncharacterized membrane protein